MQQDPSTYSSSQMMSINPQFPEHEHLNCPRCDSSNTKFCYYNNYNLSQPRHFCKNCRRYWTKGGTLRKIPIGGGTRKSIKRSSNSNKRPPNSSPPTSPPKTQPPPPAPAQLKSEPSAILGFGNSLLRSDHRGQFVSFVDDLRPNLSDGSEENDLNKTPANFLSVNIDGDRRRSGGGRGESSGCDNGGNEWPELSIFTSGSNFH